MSNKMTKKDSFSAIRTILVSANASADLISFVDNELALLAKKSGNRKPTKTQTITAQLSELVIAVLQEATEALTIANIQEKNVDLRVFNGESISPQRISAILTKLVKEGRVKKEVIKRKTHYSWVNTIQDNATDVEEDCELDDISACEDCDFDDISDCEDCVFNDISDCED